MSFDSKRGGFTLAELMVGLVLASIFAIVLFNFVSGQARFTQVQDARQEVQQNTRGALELLMSELRAVPGDGIVNASATSLEVRVPRIWGVLCGAVSGNAVNIVTPPDQAEGAVFPVDYSSTTTWGLAIQDSTVWDRAVFAVSALRDTVRYAGSNCGTTLGADLAATDTNPARALQIDLTGTPQRSDGVGHAGGAGSVAYLYQTVQYDVGSSSVAPGRWLRRRVLSSGGTAQPVAGPLASEDSPLTFTYLCGETEIDASAVANRPQVTAIRIALAMQSRPSTRSVLQVERDTITVHLRNSGAVTCP